MGGYFLTADFDTAEWFCGTGGIMKDNEIVFASPTEMYAGLYILRLEDRIVVSNSLPFIIAFCNFQYDPTYPACESFFNHNVLQGIKKYKPDVPAINNKDEKDTSIKMLRETIKNECFDTCRWNAE